MRKNLLVGCRYAGNPPSSTIVAEVIVDESGRYVSTQLNENILWRYDRRWRSVTMHQPYGDSVFTTIAGPHHFAVVNQPDAGGQIEVTLRPASDPAQVVATARFVDTWVFEGEPQAWAWVPEYIVTRQADGSNGLLRIEDDAEIDSLEGFGAAHSIVGVPDSRLVIIGGPASYSVYDPVAGRTIRHFELAGGNQAPTMRFRNGEELWLNDVETMLKIETKQFEVVDAAGSEMGAQPGSEATTHQGGFGGWNFAARNELCLVARPGLGDVLVLDAVSMLPVARGVFKSGRPTEAMLLGRNSLVATDESGTALRTRLRKVPLPAITPEQDIPVSD
jgi:hypothetical protein